LDQLCLSIQKKLYSEMEELKKWKSSIKMAVMLRRESKKRRERQVIFDMVLIIEINCTLVVFFSI